MTNADIPAVVELRAAQWPDDISTPASVAWTIDHTRDEERIARWVADDQGTLVGWAVAGLDSSTTDSLAFVHGGVRRDRRRHGIGGRLFQAADAHLRPLSASKTRTATERGDDDSARFVERRGFRPGRSDQAWSLDPTRVESADIDRRLTDARRQGLRLVAVSELMDRPRDLFALVHALELDLPGDEPVDRPFEDWAVQELQTPLFSPDASFCLVRADGEPVALTWIFLDLDHHRARHGMTGTLQTYRRRGLAHLVKLASIRRLGERGVTALYTDNDTENHDMLALNEHLGFRPLTIFDLWTRRE
jgi:GNAT superfamily N-acetyltransferase